MCFEVAIIAKYFVALGRNTHTLSFTSHLVSRSEPQNSIALKFPRKSSTRTLACIRFNRARSNVPSNISLRPLSYAVVGHARPATSWLATSQSNTSNFRSWLTKLNITAESLREGALREQTISWETLWRANPRNARVSIVYDKLCWEDLGDLSFWNLPDLVIFGTTLLYTGCRRFELQRSSDDSTVYSNFEKDETLFNSDELKLLRECLFLYFSR